MITHKRYVLTGAPGSGKTTLLHALNGNKTTCFPEVFRKLFTEAQKRGVKSPFLNDPVKLSQAIIEGRVRDFMTEKITEIHVYDRGIHDALAYLDDLKVSYPESFKEIASRHTYDKAFILPPWKEIYVNDNERIENFEKTDAIHQVLLKAYTNYGMPPIIVPKLPVQERVAFMNKHL